MWPPIVCRHERVHQTIEALRDPVPLDAPGERNSGASVRSVQCAVENNLSHRRRQLVRPSLRYDKSGSRPSRQLRYAAAGRRSEREPTRHRLQQERRRYLTGISRIDRGQHREVAVAHQGCQDRTLELPVKPGARRGEPLQSRSFWSGSRDLDS